MELAVAANNAAPGTTLLSDLVAMSTSGKSLLEIADSLASSASFVATYPTFQTATEFATEFLGNLVPEASAAAVAEGVTIIEGMLAAGDSRGKVILEAATYLAALDESNASFGTSAALFNHRVEVATYHTITSEAAAPWDIPASVTSSDDSVATGKGAVDTALAPAAATPDAAQNLVLTTNTDYLTGGDADDSITGSNTTFNSDDTIIGGAGSDTLSVTAAGAANVIANTSGVETVKIVNSAAGNYQLNMIGATDVENVMSRLSSGQVSFNNLQNLVKVWGYGVQGGAIINANFNNALASGTADSLSIELDAGSNAVVQVSGTTDTNEFETINVTASGTTAQTISLKDAGGNNPGGLKTLNVDGTSKLTQTLAGGAAKATFDASNASGVQAVTWGGNYTTLKGGSGADIIDASAGSFFGSTNPKTVVGGDGADKLILEENVTAATSNTTGVSHSVTGVETIQLNAIKADTAADTTRTYAADKLATDASTIYVKGENNEVTANADKDTDVTISALAADQKVTVSFKASAKTGADETLSVALKDASGTADEITVESVGVTSQVNSFALTAARDANNKAIETVNFIASAADVSSVDGTTLQSVDAQYSNAFNISGSGDLTITTIEIADPTGTATATIGAGSHTGNLTLSTGFKTTAADTIAITTGSGTNSVDFGTEALSADSVTGGGTDTVKVKEAATDVEMTLSSVDTLTLTGAGATKVISAKNFTDVGTINILDAGAGDAGGDNIKVTNIASGQAITVNSTDTNQEDWAGDTVTLTPATGVTEVNVKLAGDTALEGTGIFATSATTLGLEDTIKTSSYFVSQTAVIQGVTNTISTLNLSGGGASSATATATFTVSGTTNVSLATIDATALSSNLNITGVTTAAGAALTLGSGANTVTVALADLARDAMTIDGGDGADTVTFAADADNATYRPGLTSVETLSVAMKDASAGAVVVDLSDANGDVDTIKLNVNDAEHGTTIQKGAISNLVLAGNYNGTNATNYAVTVTDSAADLTVTNSAAVGDDNTDLTVSKATSVTIKQAHASAIDFETLTLTKATSATLGGGGKAGAITAQTTSAPLLTTLTLDSSDGAISLPTLTAVKLTTIDISGDNTVTIGNTAATTSALATINAGSATAAVSIGQNVDLVANASITTGTGNDTVNIDILTEGTTSVDMGEKASDSDLLNLFGANNMGLTVVNLSATDQITQLNGSVNSESQTGIENVDASGLSGSFGVNITGSGDANVLTGTGNADNFTGGEGGDTIEGGAGNDTIGLAESTAKIDYVRHTATTDGTDTITGFGTTDVFDIDVALVDDDGGARDLTGYSGTTDFAAASFLTLDNTDLNAATGFNAGEDVLLEIGSGVATVGAVTVAGFEAAFDTVLDVKTANSQGKLLFIAYDGTGTDADAGLYLVDFSTANGATKALEAGDSVTLLAVFQDVGADALTAANFL